MRVIAFGILALIVSLAAIHESSSESATIMAEQAATPESTAPLAAAEKKKPKIPEDSLRAPTSPRKRRRRWKRL
jgi:hypothetical protein